MKKHQSGSVLAISLVLLTAITLIAMMNMQRSGLQTKVVANFQHQEAVFNQATNMAEVAFGALNALDYGEKRAILVTAQEAYYLHKVDNAQSSTIPYLTNSNTPHITNLVTIQHKPSLSTKEEHLTASTREQFSRGLNLSDKPRFQLIANSQARNGSIQSTQVIGFNPVPKPQILISTPGGS